MDVNLKACPMMLMGKDRRNFITLGALEEHVQCIGNLCMAFQDGKCGLVAKNVVNPYKVVAGKS